MGPPSSEGLLTAAELATRKLGLHNNQSEAWVAVKGCSKGERVDGTDCRLDLYTNGIGIILPHLCMSSRLAGWQAGSCVHECTRGLGWRTSMAELVLGWDEASASSEAPVVPVICCRRSQTAAQSTCACHHIQ